MAPEMWGIAAPEMYGIVGSEIWGIVGSEMREIMGSEIWQGNYGVGDMAKAGSETWEMRGLPAGASPQRPMRSPRAPRAAPPPPGGGATTTRDRRARDFGKGEGGWIGVGGEGGYRGGVGGVGV